MVLNDFRSQVIEWDKATGGIYESISASKGDSNGRKLIVHVLNEREEEDLTGSVLSLAWHLKENQGLDAFVPIDETKGIFEIYYTTGMLSNIGTLTASLVLVTPTGRIESKPFKIFVQESVVDDTAVQSQNSFTALTQALVRVSDVITSFEALHTEKSDLMDGLYIDKKSDMEALELDYQSRAEALETTYAPRLTGVEGEIGVARGGATTLGERLDSEKAEFSAQLAQTDLVDLLKNHNASGNKVFFRKKGLFDFSAIIPFGGNKGAVYNFKRPPIANEEYILLQDGYVSDLEKTKTIIGQDFTINKDFDSRTGDFYDIVLGGPMANANNYARESGATMTVNFNGDYIAFNAYKHSSGGVWEFVLDGNTVGKKVVSVYSPTTINAVTEVLWEGLEKTNHTVVATFVGDDPNNQPSGGVGTSRGWFKYSDGGRFESTTFTIKETHQTEWDSVIESKRFDVMRDNSNKEFAIRVRPSGTSLPTEFMPGHVTTATAFANEQKLLIDGEEVTDWSLSEYVEASVIQLIQRMEVIYPSTEAHIANVYSVHTVNSEGVSVKVNIDFLQDLFCTTGYSLMFPVKNSFAKRLVTSNGDTYQSTKTDGSSTEIFENDPLSYLFYNTGGTDGEEDYAVGLTVQNPTRTYRKGKSGRRDPIAWLQHRDSDMQKIYMQVYQNTEIEAGERLSIGGTFYIGALPDAQLNFE